MKYSVVNKWIKQNEGWGRREPFRFCKELSIKLGGIDGIRYVPLISDLEKIGDEYSFICGFAVSPHKADNF